jgi:hypothetical protein
MLRTISNKSQFINLSAELDKEITALSSQILAADFRGYDPYDLLDRMATAPDSPSIRLWRKAAAIANRTVPLPARVLLRIQPQLNPKTLGLCLRSFALLQEHETSNNKWCAATEQALVLLNQTRSSRYSMPIWGYPFDWRTRVLIPRGTPSAVVNFFIIDGLMEWFRISGESRFLDMSCEICEFFVRYLNRSPGVGTSFCFSYTPIDHFHVHNANLFVAAALIRVGAAAKMSAWIELGQQAVEYALADQREDGSLSYWASDQMEPGNPRIDHYHSGFEIRMLSRIGCMLDNPKILAASRRYYDFYLNKLLHACENIIMPKYSPEMIYPVDIHSCAELMILNAELSSNKDFPESFDILKRGTKWVLENMRRKCGGYYARIEDCRFFKLHVKIPYMRWGMAWMLLALILCKSCLSE